MKNKRLIFLGSVITVIFSLLSGCATPKQWSAVGGSRADGTVLLTYHVGAFEKPVLEEGQGIRVASQLCRAWGYSDAQAFGGATQQCTAYNQYGCVAWQIYANCQCIGNGNEVSKEAGTGLPTFRLAVDPQRTPSKTTEDKPIEMGQAIDCRVNDKDISGLYSGDCVDGVAHGIGLSVGRDRYRGEFENGYKHGQGIYTWGKKSEWTGQIFTGQSINDELVSGEWEFQDGTIKEGTFKNSALNGYGTTKHPDGTVTEGIFKDDKLIINCKGAGAANCQAEAEKEGERLAVFEGLLNSTKPTEVFLAGVKFETESNYDKAKTMYNQVITNFPNDPIALKAADRLLAINDKR